MAIPIPSVGSLIYTTFIPSTVPVAMNAIQAALVAAGWTSVSVGSQAQIAINSLPGNGATYSVGGVTYTFQTSLNNAVANNIQIAANITLQAQYIADSINASVGGGTEWSTPTSSNPVVTATSSGNIVQFTSIATGTGANTQFTVSGFGSPTSQGRGFICTSALTPQGLQANCYIIDTQPAPNLEGQTISIWPGSADGSLQAGATVIGGGNGGASGFFGSLTITSSYTLRILANAHQFFIWLPGSFSTQGTELGMIVPFMRAAQTSVGIAALSNSSGLVEVQTSTAHGLTTGQSVTLFGGNLPSGSTGVFVITVIDSTHFTLNGSTYAAGYTAGGLVGGSGGAGTVGTISRCFVAWWDFSWVNGQSGHKTTWRNQVGVGQGYYCVNENAYGILGGNTLFGQALFVQPRSGGAYQCWGGLANDNEVQIGWPGTASTATFKVMGEVWGAMIICDSVIMDETITGYLGHNWFNMTNLDGLASLFLATS